MYRFLLRPAWIGFHLLVIAAVVAMVNLGFWQLRRLDERKEFNRAVSERSEQPPVPLEDLLADPEFDPAEHEWRQVTVSGTWLEPQVLVFNRTQGGRAGDNVLTALATGDDSTDGGTVVLVNRGFVPLGEEIPDAPSTEAAVLGRVRLSQSRQRGGLTDSSAGSSTGADEAITEVRRIEIDRLAPQYDGAYGGANGGANDGANDGANGDGSTAGVAPVYLDLIESDPPVRATDPAPVPAPELGEGNHLSYAFQWFIFAVCVAIGWVLAVRRSIGTRRTAGADAAPDRSEVSDPRARPSAGTAR